MNAGPWAHVDPPDSVPAWIDCSGFSGTFAYSHRPTPRSQAIHTHLLVRATAFPDSDRPGYAVVVDLPVDDQVRQQLRRETGVEVKDMSEVAGSGDVKP